VRFGSRLTLETRRSSIMPVAALASPSVSMSVSSSASQPPVSQYSVELVEAPPLS